MVWYPETKPLLLCDLLIICTHTALDYTPPSYTVALTLWQKNNSVTAVQFTKHLVLDFLY